MHIASRIVVSLILAAVPAALQAANSPALEELLQLHQGAPSSAFAPAILPMSAPLEPLIKPVQQPALGLSRDELSRIYGASRYIQQYHIDGADNNKLYCGAMKGMFKELDPYSQFFCGKEEADKFRETLGGSFGGIGAELLNKDKGKPQVIGYVYPGSPAALAGLRSQDRIVAVNGTNVGPLTTDEVVNKIRGPKGSTVRLDIERVIEQEGDKAPKKAERFVKEVVRGQISIPNAYAKMIAPGKGYVYFNEFRDSTYKTVMTKINELIAAGAKSLIIDVRNNPGGLLSSVNDISSEFLPRGSVLVRKRDRQGREEPMYSGFQGRLQAIPLVVIVNGHSASASEILAGALQDHKRAVIVGRQTFGKGTVQTTIPLEMLMPSGFPSDGSLVKMTIEKWYTPGGRSIQKDKDGKGGGVTPDHVVAMSEEDEAKVMAAVRDGLLDRAPEGEQAADPDLEKALSIH